MTAVILTITVFIGGSLQAQVTHTTISYGPPKIVNFHDRVAWQKTHATTLPKNSTGLAGERPHQGGDRLYFSNTAQAVPANAPVSEVNSKTLMAAPASSANSSTSPPPTLTFTGDTDNGTVNPPDPGVAVGKDFLVETTSQELRIYKRNGFNYESILFEALFDNLSISYYNNPHIVYDPNNDRFIISMLGYDKYGSSTVFVAVSEIGDPTFNWYLYSFSCLDSQIGSPEFIHLGFNSNWVVLTTNNILTNGYFNNYIYALNRNSLYSGSLGLMNFFSDPQATKLVPAITYDASQGTEYLVEDLNGNSNGTGYVNLYALTPGTTTPTYGLVSALGVKNTTWNYGPNVAPQYSSTTPMVQSGYPDITSCVYRNKQLWFTHTVYLPTSYPTHSAVDWWQVDPASLTVSQFGRLEDATGKIFYYYPSLDVNTNGDMLLGFTSSSINTPITNGYAMKLASDPAGTLASPINYATASGPYTRNNGAGLLWGYYSGTAFDPSDNSFWTAQQSANSATTWTTVLAHIPYTGPCSTPRGLNASSSATDTVTVNWVPVLAVPAYNLRMKSEYFSGWVTYNLITNSYVFKGYPGFKYYFQVQSVCGSSTDTSAWSSVDSVETPGYCTSGGGNSSSEYIRTVKLKTINNTVANDGGYGDFAYMRTVLPVGSRDTITLTPGFSGSSSTEYWTVYIDYNRTGVLNDASEIVATGSGSGPVSAIFTLPASAKNGFVRMRIQMHRGSAITDPCATLDYGDVQDYEVLITGGTNALAEEDASLVQSVTKNKLDIAPDAAAGLKVFPNPVSASMAPTIQYNLAKEGNVSLKLIDISGRILQQVNLGDQYAGQHTYLLSSPGNHLVAGYYIIVLEQDKQVIARSPFIVK